MVISTAPRARDAGEPEAVGADPRGLPSATTVRFLVLVILVVVTTGALGGYLWQVLHPASGQLAAACTSTPTGQLVRRGVGPAWRSTVLFLNCVQNSGGPLAWWWLAGAALVLAAGSGLYAAMPWWTRRVGWSWRSPLRSHPLDDFDPVRDRALDAQLDELVAQAGLTRKDVEFVVDPRDPRVDAWTFGRGRHAVVGMNRGLMLVGLRGAKQAPAKQASGERPPAPDRAAEAARFAQVIRHELGHVRARDNRPTYLTVALWRAFVAALVTVYCVALGLAGPRGSLPDLGTASALVALTGLVYLTRCSVLRVRELHADVEATRFDGAPHAESLAADYRALTPVPWYRRLAHPSWERRAQVLTSARGTLYDTDRLALFAAGTAISQVVANVALPVAAALLSSPLLADGGLNGRSARHAVLVLLLLLGPPALMMSVLITGLACMVAWRAHGRRTAATATVITITTAAAAAYDSSPDEAFPRAAAPTTGLPVARWALWLTAGLLVGDHLSLGYVMAGNWMSASDTTARDAVVLAVYALLLAVVLTAVFRWAVDLAELWWPAGPPRSRAGRFMRAGAVAVGAIGALPLCMAWFTPHGLPLSAQIQRPAPGLVPGLPYAGVVFTHFLPVGFLDLLPGATVALALPPVLAAAGVLRRRPGAPNASQDRAAVAGALLRGLTGAVVAVVLTGAAVLWLRHVTGAPRLTHLASTEYGLRYLTVVAENLIAIVAGLAALRTAMRTRRARYSLAALTAATTAAAASALAQRTLFLGVFGWHTALTDWAHAGFFDGVFAATIPIKGAAVTALLLVCYAGWRPATRSLRDGRLGTRLGRLPSWAVASLLLAVPAALCVGCYLFLTVDLTT